jgi:hypothetical protein
MEPSVDTAVILLAVLKAGGSYMWKQRADRALWPLGVSMARPGSDEEGTWQALDVGELLARALPGPNLPVLTRPSDIACVLPAEAERLLLVPHETLAALRANATVPVVYWTDDDAGAFGLWVGLMSGITVSLAAETPAAAA